jgi:hypothetical protein
MLEAVLDPLLNLITRSCSQPVVMQHMNLVQSMVRLYGSLLQPIINPPPPPPPGALPSGPKPPTPLDMQVIFGPKKKTCLRIAIHLAL